VAGAVSVVVALLALMLLVLPKMGQVSKARDELAQAHDQEASLRAQVQALQEAQASAPKTKRQIAKISGEIPPTVDQPGLIRLLTDAADRSAVDPFTLSFSNPTLDTGGQFSVIPVQITANGTYFSLDEFLFRLETLPRAAKVTAITVAPGGETTGTTTTTTTTSTGELAMQLTVEFYTTDTSAGPGSQPGPTQSATTPGA